MAIPDEDVARVRTATDIVALIGEHVALKQQGRRWSGLCPFHPEKTPSFSVNPEMGVYYCFGCQASGDSISFVRATEHLSFVEAVRLLADRSGVVIHEDAEAGRERQRRTALIDALEAATAWYHDRLLQAPDAGPARDYLRSRGYDGTLVRQFRLGWAPDDWDALSRALGLPERVMSDAGLGFVNRRGRPQDAFRARVIFPICDPSGHPVALGGRILPGGGGGGGGGASRSGAGGGAASAERAPQPKYKNSQETAIYSKRRTLYALNWAKHDVVASGEVVVCEGYTDVIGFFQAGLPRAVATCGTSLAEEHFTLLRNFAKRIVLAYDADNAGQSATSRVYEWERRHEVDVAVAELPLGTDPGELARTDPDLLREAVARAQPFLQFRVSRVFADADLSTAEGRARAADQALAAVAEHPDDLVRDQYVMQIADRCRIDADRVRERLQRARSRPPSAGARPGPNERPSRGVGEPSTGGSVPFGEEGDTGSPSERGDGAPRSAGPARPPPSMARPGLEALRLAVHRPEAVADRLEAVLFNDDLQRRAFLLLAEADGVHEAIAGAPPDVADLLRRVVVDEPLSGDDGLGDPVDGVLIPMVREASRRGLAEVQAKARMVPESLAQAAAETAQVQLHLALLDDPGDSRAASDWLLAWLLGRGEERR